MMILPFLLSMEILYRLLYMNHGDEDDGGVDGVEKNWIVDSID
jgi:hypothetical protein